MDREKRSWWKQVGDNFKKMFLLNSYVVSERFILTVYSSIDNDLIF